MKKLLFVLFLTFACSSLYAQVHKNQPGDTCYSNGDSYGVYIDDIPGAVSYDWSVDGTSQATIWPGWDTAIDLTFSHRGYCVVTCMVTMSNSAVVPYTLYIDVYDE
ncbi:MAG: hypothetical protein V4592_03760 [Bacteroidota bacterium]